MRAIGNFLWFILGGALMGLAWWLVGVVAFVSIVGIPWGKACFVIGQFSFFPFGKEALSRKELKQTDDIGTSALGINQEVAAAKAIIAKIRGGQLPKTFSSKEVWRPGWANLTDREQVSAALRMLADLDWLGVSKVETQGRTATAYTANPRAF